MEWTFLNIHLLLCLVALWLLLQCVIALYRAVQEYRRSTRTTLGLHVESHPIYSTCLACVNILRNVVMFLQIWERVIVLMEYTVLHHTLIKIIALYNLFRLLFRWVISFKTKGTSNQSEVKGDNSSPSEISDKNSTKEVQKQPHPAEGSSENALPSSVVNTVELASNERPTACEQQEQDEQTEAVSASVPPSDTVRNEPHPAKSESVLPSSVVAPCELASNESPAACEQHEENEQTETVSASVPPSETNQPSAKDSDASDQSGLQLVAATASQKKHKVKKKRRKKKTSSESTSDVSHSDVGEQQFLNIPDSATKEGACRHPKFILHGEEITPTIMEKVKNIGEVTAVELTKQIPLSKPEETGETQVMKNSQVPNHEVPCLPKLPIQGHYQWRVCCNICLRKTNHLELYTVSSGAHSCDNDILLIKKEKDDLWVKIRDRRNQRIPHSVKYVMCSRVMQGEICFRPARCWYPHNKLELVLWNFDRNGSHEFTISNFVGNISRKSEVTQSSSLSDNPAAGITTKHPGSFLYLCNGCFCEAPSKISVQNINDKGMCSLGRHPLNSSLLLFHLDITGRFTPIGQRPAVPNPELCSEEGFCRANSSCTDLCSLYAHSLVELDVWILEVSSTFKRDSLVRQIQAQTGRQQSEEVKQYRKPSHAIGTSSTEKHSKCPFRIVRVCSQCQCCDTGTLNCTYPGSTHKWYENQVMIMPSNHTIRKLPLRIPNSKRFEMCRYVSQGMGCFRKTDCQFGHVEEDLEVWHWMAVNHVHTLEELCKLSKESQLEKVERSARPVIPARPTPQQIQWPSNTTTGIFYCKYCFKQCNSTRQFEYHCSSTSHLANIESDKDHQWNYRPPPPHNYIQFRLCEQHIRASYCVYSNVTDMHNYCTEAHSQEELDEWKERIQFRQMKQILAKNMNMYSYMDKLLEEYHKALHPLQVLTEKLDWIQLQCSHKLTVYKKKKKASHQWSFEIEYQDVEKKVKTVSLLYNHDRTHFKIVDCGDEDQMADGDLFKCYSEDEDIYHYKIDVLFTGNIYGSFTQCLAFDFGERPVFMCKLRVNVGEKFTIEEKQAKKHGYTFERWTPDKQIIIKYPTNEESWAEQLLKVYPPPTQEYSKFLSSDGKLNQYNYVHCMKQFVQMEEITCSNILSRLNRTVSIDIMRTISEDGIFINASPGEMFARIPLDCELSPETDAGWLVLRRVRRILLKPSASSSTGEVYEADLVTKENFDFHGLGREFCYACLSARCVDDLLLRNKKSLTVDIQFEVDRSPFCKMTYALNEIDANLVIPDIARGYDPFINEDTTWDIKTTSSGKQPNDIQMRIMKHIVQDRKAHIPPIVLYGPFGTGKTEILAQSTMDLMSVKRDTAKVLICTHTNSAADIYILKHFNEFLKKNPRIKLCRVYPVIRRVATIPQDVRQYCLLSNDRISPPGADTIQDKHIVVTTFATAAMLIGIGELKGYFTHIFLDEAAQALETEVIIPLALATRKTCVVLAGDHLQMHLKIFSEEAEKWLIHRSYLERLFHHYKNHSCDKDGKHPLNTILSINYRTTETILKFIARVFYDGEDKLISRCMIPETSSIKPMNLYTSYGETKPDTSSSTYYNEAEVGEVAARVEDLYNNWPHEWGERKPTLIGVVTPYSAQVKLIRKVLREKKLSGVNVETTENVQGKEYTALFISTVYSRHSVKDATSQTKDLAFLSDKYLLNATFTRTKAFIGVVGDPIALCGIGSCSKIWTQFLLRCHELQSIQPDGVGPNGVLLQVQMLHNEENNPRDQLVQANGGQINCMPKPDQIVDLADWDLDDLDFEPDDIIRQLGEQTQKLSQQEKMVTNEATVPESTTGNVPFGIECVRIKQKQGRMVIESQTYVNSSRKKIKKTMHEDDFHSDSDSTEEVLSGEGDHAIHKDYSHQALQRMMEEQPDVYKRCRLAIHNASRITATVLDADDPLRKVNISSRFRCGRSFPNDEVVVELIPGDKEDKKFRKNADSTPQGKVIGVLKRSIKSMRYRRFVCYVDDYNCGMFIPLSRTLPKFGNLETEYQPRKDNAVTVYQLNHNKSIRFHKYEHIDPSSTKEKLFVVRYLKWRAEFLFPMGIVIECLPRGSSFAESLKILNLIYFVPPKYRPSTMREIETKFKDFNLPEKEMDHRNDFRNKLVFTIDPEGSEDLDDALSIETSDDLFKVGIHIADVSYFIEKGCEIDIEAQRRGVSFYPCGQNAVHMIPEKLSTHWCSLKPNECRPTISVIITLNKEYTVLKEEICRSCIISKHKLSYAQAETALEHQRQQQSGLSDELVEALSNLYKISLHWRQCRLGNEGLHFNERGDARESLRAHILVAEMNVMANRTIADKLFENKLTRSCLPLIVQNSPDRDDVDSWKDKFGNVAQFTFSLTKAFQSTEPFQSTNDLCLCITSCMCTSNPKEELEEDTKLLISEESLGKMRTMVRHGNFGKIPYFMHNPEASPMIYAAVLNWQKIQGKSMYCPCSEQTSDKRRHYSMNLDLYTHFTSPIRRFIDIVIHRLVVAMIRNSPCLPYTPNEISEICAQCTESTRRSNQYQDETNVLKICDKIKSEPLLTQFIVDEVDDKEIKARCYVMDELRSFHGKLPMSLLRPAKQVIVENKKEVNISWRERIYNTVQDKPPLPRPSGIPPDFVLNPHSFAVPVNSRVWRDLIFAGVQEDIGEIRRCSENIVASYQRSNGYVKDITSEFDRTPQVHALTIINKTPLCKFSLKVEPGTLFMMQLSAVLERGLLKPDIQLLWLTPTYCICFEHRSDPVSCFTKGCSNKASKTRYIDVHQYKKLWMELVAIEAAHAAGKSGEVMVFHNVDIKWEESENVDSIAEIKLKEDFCDDRNLKFPRIAKDIDYWFREPEEIAQDFSQHEQRREDEGNREEPDLLYDYFCIRYPVSDGSKLIKPHWGTTPEDDEVERERYTKQWVGHCMSSKMSRMPSIWPVERGDDPDEWKQIYISLQYRQNKQNRIKFPRELLQEDNDHKASVEYIVKALPHRREEEALFNLPKACQLSQDIAVGKSTKDLFSEYDARALQDLQNVILPGMRKPNDSQQIAIDKAIKQQFTLIQGPPGTGKTATGARLAYLFHKLNTGNRGQVMYCGPSNKSVDVVLKDYLLKSRHMHKYIVRVYSEIIEHKEFPLPLDDVIIESRRVKEYALDDEMKKIALHHLIREKGQCSKYKEITRMDRMIRNCKRTQNDLTKEEKQRYKDMIKWAKIEVLQKKSIVFCTCHSSYGPVVTRGTSIKQLIIDESAMCTEPESMVPIISTRPKQVVLLGDHKQLRPIIVAQKAKDLGLDKSLFERYKKYDEGREKLSIMLTIQYRMHEAIQSFPSEHFYENKLQCGNPDIQTRPSTLKNFWPGGPDKPIAFVHTVGIEDTLTVATVDGNEQSKSNQVEVEKTVEIVSRLIELGVKGENIIILSQYRAQCAKIESSIKSNQALKGVTVSTVVAAQGSEQDYVILTTVRSLPKDQIETKPPVSWMRKHLGFITDENQINVALTRAKLGLIIIGNRNLLECHSMWKKLLEHYSLHKKIVDAANFPPTLR